VEWIMAAHWANHTYQSFRELDGEEQSKLVAAYRIEKHAEALLAQEQAAKARQHRGGTRVRAPRRR
jgi:hypothetical protein